MDLQAYLITEQVLLSRRMKHIEEELRSMPDGWLSINRNGRLIRWRRSYDDKPSELISKKDVVLADELAYKNYLETCRKMAESRLCMIRDLLQNCPPPHTSPIHWNPEDREMHSLLLSYCKRRVKEQESCLSAEFRSAAEGLLENPNLKWLSENFESCREHPEYLIVPTLSNVKVRSKSEALIADELFRQHIPFRYESALPVNGITFYPDFLILSPRGDQHTVIWEHFGLMGNESYSQNMKTKLSAYLDAGYLPGIDLIMTFERKQQPLDINYVKMLIAYHFG